MKRGGQHAIINWLAQQFEEEVHHYNGCHFNGEWEIIPTRAEWVIEYRHGNKYDYRKSGYKRFIDMRNPPIVQQIFNFEDYYVKNVIDKLKFENYILFVVIRDAYNLFASVLKYVENRGKESDYYLNNPDERTKRLLDHYSYTEHHLNFNKWFVDKEYRDSICESLGLKNTDAGRNEIGDFGKGSSFSKLECDGKATEMNVLERYKHFLNNEKYLEMVSNEDLKEQTNKIFNIQL
jgi:hypothetical protein